MAKKLIRLTESDLRNVVRESVNRILREADFSTFPYKGDFNERNKWWKSQMDNDFPNHGIDSSDDFQREYNTLQANKANQDKLDAKKAKEDARLAARAEKEVAKNERMAAKAEKRSLFEKAVEYTLYGDESLLSNDQYMNLGDENWGDEEWNDWFDGITKLPLFLKDTRSKVMSQIFGVGLNNATYDDSGYDYTCEWGVNWGKEDNQIAGIVIGVKLDEMSNMVYAKILYCNNEAIHTGRSNILINKFINGQIRKNMKIIADRMAKWKNYNFVQPQ